MIIFNCVVKVHTDVIIFYHVRVIIFVLFFSPSSLKCLVSLYIPFDYEKTDYKHDGESWEEGQIRTSKINHFGQQAIAHKLKLFNFITRR